MLLKAQFHTIGAWRRHKDIFTDRQLPYQMNDKAVYRTAPATPGLLIKCCDFTRAFFFISQFQKHICWCNCKYLTINAKLFLEVHLYIYLVEVVLVNLYSFNQLICRSTAILKGLYFY